MQLNTLLQQALEILKPHSREVQLEVETILCEVLKIPRYKLIAHSKKQISQRKEKQILELINQRKQGIPLAYLLGKKEFYGRDYKVNPAVLIPRPETEELVELSLSYLKQIYIDQVSTHNRPIKVLDIGTGSGCIAITVLLESLDLNIPISVKAVDISIKALEVTKENITKLVGKKHHSKISLEQVDILSQKIKPRYDLILSNPPYIPSTRIAKLDPVVVEHEPIKALDGGEKGTVFLAKILELFGNNKTPSRMIVETDHTHKKALKHLIKQSKADKYIRDLQFKQDLSGKDRFLIMTK